MSDKKSKKGAQGAPLPDDGSPLSAYPVGACVLIEIDGSSDWYLIAFNIGKVGNPHLRKLVHPPTSLDWNTGPSAAHEFSCRLVVQQSAWPRRATDDRARDADVDPDPLLNYVHSDESDVPELPSASPAGGGL